MIGAKNPPWKNALAAVGESALTVLVRWVSMGERSRGERQLCPRRAEAPWKTQVGEHDTWRTDRWHWTHRLRDAWKNRMCDNFSGGTKWPYLEVPPRTCSYCGGVHPEDAIRLVDQGWKADPTDKRYKWYLRPVGDLSGPVPPVKLYNVHFSDDQIRRFNQAVDRSRKVS